MPQQQESALETCQRAEGMLGEVERLALVPGTDMLAQWESELGQVAVLLETVHDSMTEECAPRSNPALREVIEGIQRKAAKLKIQCEHGSNYCMGLLQVRLGTGYSENGLPVLISAEATRTFEG